MARLIRPEILWIAGSLLWGAICALMSAIGLWIVYQAARGQLHLTRPKAIVFLIVLGFAGVILSACFYFVGKRNLELEARERESEARFRGILEAAPDAMILANRAGQVVVANAQTERMFGYERSELIGMGIEQLMPERFRERHVAQRGHYHAHPHHRTMGMGLDLSGLRKDGTEFPVEISLSPLEHPEGMLVIASIRDITEQLRAMEEIAQRTAELRKSQEVSELKDHFLSSLSHEMKTPLSLIFGYAELLEEKYPQEELLDGILDGSRRLNEHISNMLDYSALVSGTLSLYKTEVNLAEVIESVHASFEEGLRSRQIRFSSEVDPETPAIQADARRIVQVIGELLENAVKFTPECGALGVRVQPEAGMVVIEVWDTGPGIPEFEQRRIWEAFTQLDVGNAFRKGGLGLGLTLVKSLSELHGGRVDLASKVGEGSRFYVRLPIEPGTCSGPRIR